ncbi:MAG: hypothetical protein AAGD25_06880 [Cyanobacteria bacterium P01_F01_bin.150]
MTPLKLRHAIQRVIGDHIGTYSNGDVAIQNGDRISENSVTGGIEVVISPYLRGNPDRVRYFEVSLISHEPEMYLDEIGELLINSTDEEINVDRRGVQPMPLSRKGFQWVKLNMHATKATKQI